MTIKYSNGVERYAINLDYALSQIAAKQGCKPADLVTHDDGARVLVWEDEEHARDDDGAKAIASIIK